MNIVLLDPRQTQAETWTISSKAIEHLHTSCKVGNTLRIGVQGFASRYLTEIVDISEHTIAFFDQVKKACSIKIAVTLIVALPRPKVLLFNV